MALKKTPLSQAVHKLVHGWNPDLPDVRDHIYNESAHHVRDRQTIKSQMDFRSGPNMPAVRDQGQEGCCTGFGSMGSFAFVYTMQGGVKQVFSPAFAYYIGRAYEGTEDQDSGAQIRDVVKGIAKLGTVAEKEFPYKVGGFAKKPTKKDYADALKHEALEYLRVENAGTAGQSAIVACLAAGYPIVYGATLYESFESDAVATSGIVPMPTKNEKVIGGHCTWLCGYNLNKAYPGGKGMALAMNSWGTSWGQKGFFWIPLAYLTNGNLCDDFWTFRKVA